MANEVYVSLDIEADGPAPGPYSMLALGAAAFTLDSGLVDQFEAHLDLLEGAGQHPDTMAWWATQPDAWTVIRSNLEPPADAMKRFDQWLAALPGKPIAVGYPAAYDFQYVNVYLHRFVGRNRLGHSALDIKSFAMVLLGLDTFAATAKSRMPARWFAGCPPHTHVPVDDAIEQGVLFLNMLRDHLARQG